MVRIYESDVDENKKRFAGNCETLFLKQYKSTLNVYLCI